VAVMKFLIDTQCFLWGTTAPERLRQEAVDLIASTENAVIFSAVSALEIAIKFSIGKLQLPEPPEIYVPSRVSTLSLVMLPVFLSHALQVAVLPHHHRDPFDRLLIAQSQIERVPLMTADATFVKYDIEIIWAGRDRSPRKLRPN
jgi:PIN domain nuclease of toxin-antitoxin system